MLQLLFHAWERRLASVTKDRIVRPFEWGLDWMPQNGHPIDHRIDTSAAVRWPAATSAMAASIAYRCEIDLSPGGRTRPRMRAAGCTVTAKVADMRQL
jgi:hypothetical protein